MYINRSNYHMEGTPALKNGFKPKKTSSREQAERTWGKMGKT